MLVACGIDCVLRLSYVPSLLPPLQDDYPKWSEVSSVFAAQRGDLKYSLPDEALLSAAITGLRRCAQVGGPSAVTDLTPPCFHIGKLVLETRSYETVAQKLVELGAIEAGECVSPPV